MPVGEIWDEETRNKKYEKVDDQADKRSHASLSNNPNRTSQSENILYSLAAVAIADSYSATLSSSDPAISTEPDIRVSPRPAHVRVRAQLDAGTASPRQGRLAPEGAT